MEKLIKAFSTEFEKIARSYDPTYDESKERVEALKSVSRQTPPKTEKSVLTGAGIGSAAGAGLGALIGKNKLKAALIGALGGAATGGLAGYAHAKGRQGEISDAQRRLKTPRARLLRQLRLEVQRDADEAADDKSREERYHQLRMIREAGRAARGVIHGTQIGPFDY